MKIPMPIVAFLALLSVSVASSAKLNVVTTLPDYAALAREVGGANVDVTAMAKATEDPHFVDARPSLVVKLRSADVLIEGGAELETGWLPPLLQSARNAKIAPGAPGRIIASTGIRLMNIPANASRAEGDVHAAGNPHFAIDPIIAKAIAQNIAQTFARLDAANAAAYQANYKAFEQKVNAKLQEWGAAMLPYKGQKVAAYHDSWVYFAHRFGLEIDTFLEPKPGIPPSPSHLAAVITKIKADKIRAILVEPFQNRKIAEKVASSTGAKVVDGGHFPAEGESYIAHLDAVVSRVAAALKGS
jgi:zinc/manganese transport system substrate-binding protein